VGEPYQPKTACAHRLNNQDESYAVSIKRLQKDFSLPSEMSYASKPELAACRATASNSRQHKMRINLK
jgi:hypothetical protein